MPRCPRILLCSIALTIAVAASAGQETPIELSEVPDEILAIAKKTLPDARIAGANKETEPQGGFLYEIQGSLPDGRKVEFDIRPDGEIEEIEIELAREMVPGAVLKAIERRLPGFEPEFIEASHSPSLKVMRYELAGKMGANELDIEVSANGRQITVADR